MECSLSWAHPPWDRGEGIESEEGTPGVICIAVSLGWQINSISGLQPETLCQEECEAASGFWLTNVTIEACPGQ